MTLLTEDDFPALQELGWSGCMHDSDCACSPEQQEEDSYAIEGYLRRKNKHPRPTRLRGLEEETAEPVNPRADALEEAAAIALEGHRHGQTALQLAAKLKNLAMIARAKDKKK